MDTMLFWHGVLVECGVALGLEAALLLGLAVIAERPRVERFAAALPAAGNMLAFTLARGVQASADGWQRVLAYQAAYGPNYLRTFKRENAQALADVGTAAQRSGIAVLLLAEVLLAFGGACILLWLRPPAWLKRVTGRRRPVAEPPAPATQVITTDDDALEVWVESLER